jgi:hypothetical protein
MERLMSAQSEGVERAMLANEKARRRLTAVMRRWAVLPPDKTEIRDFVNALFKYADADTHVSLRAFYGDSEAWRPGWGNVKLNGSGLGELIDTATRLAGRCANAREKVVFCPPIATFRTERNAKGVNLACGLVLTVECDRAAEAARERLEGILGPATVVVASGGEWTDPYTGETSDKLHLHWRLSEPTRDRNAHAQLKQARQIAAQLVGADKTAANPVHPLRWPGSWHRKEVPRLANIVTLNDDAEIELGDTLNRLREAAALAGIDPSSDPRPGPDAVADIIDVVSALAIIPNPDLPWAEWNRKGLAIWRATGGSEEGREAFHKWSSKSGKYDPTATDERWDHFATSPPNQIGAKTLFFEARQADPDWKAPSLEAFVDEVFEVLESALDEWDAGDDNDPIPPRGWLLGNVFCRRVVSSLIGDGGTGKTALRTAQCLALATKRKLTGEHVFQRCRVLIVCLEDDRDELRRRVRAAMLHHGISAADVRGWLFLSAPGLKAGKLAITQKNGNHEIGDLVGNLASVIVRRRIDLVCIDPLVKAHSVEENSNDAMDFVVSTLTGIAIDHDCAVDTPHHTSKGANQATLVAAG